MSFRFRRTLKIAPGVRLNVSKRGVSASVGPRGSTATIGRQGVYGNVGIPGTGMSYRKKLGAATDSGGSPSRNSDASAQGGLGVNLSLQDTGEVHIRDEFGDPLTPRLMRLLREEKGEFLKSWLTEQCEKWNQGIDEILNIHLETPAPRPSRSYQPEQFGEAKPTRPLPKKPDFLAKFIRSRRERIEEANRSKLEAYESDLRKWEEEKSRVELANAHHQRVHSAAQQGDSAAMQELLELTLAKLDWPRETSISFEISNDGTEAYLDVDFPEIEDLPTQEASVAARGLKLNIREKSERQLRKEYMAHVHGILFRLTGEVFNLLPTISVVCISGFSQRPDKTTGHSGDEYLISTRVERSAWEEINFNNLAELDLPACFERFDLRRKMTKTGIFSAIEPFSLADA